MEIGEGGGTDSACLPIATAGWKALDQSWNTTGGNLGCGV